ncbi:2-phosphosulfolactate phosphatase XcbC [Methylohalobius crimeensis]|uniref:argininosuccinate lyase n=1 Tax=Methylohalobius crimeensis TaxID=244365 RepID=UPI0003B76C52|nr:lyase family protein [Methylohalobius crimeensis]
MMHIPSLQRQVLEVGTRLDEPPSAGLQQTAFAEEIAAQECLHEAVGWADIAYTLMQARLRTIPPGAAAELMAALLELQLTDTCGELDPALGDVVTNREAWLAGKTGAIGHLGAGRARREAITTGFVLVLRTQVLRLAEALCAMVTQIAGLAEAHCSTVFPEYTYLQTAQPTTFGHYLSGFAFPAERDLQRLRGFYARLNRCPAGCGSSNGSRLPQDRQMLADLLGFDGVVEHARDAMWQADLPIELASCLVIIAVNVSRLAEDLMVFATREFALLNLADRHCRASKIMPQKKNPFALSYLRSLANHLLGAQTAIAASARTPSGQMDNRMEAYRELPPSVERVTAGVNLMTEILGGLQLHEINCRATLAASFALATDLAEGLASLGAADFREAHRITARLVGTLASSGRRLSDANADLIDDIAMEELGRPLGLRDDMLPALTDADAAIRARTTIGGAAPKRVLEAVAALRGRVAGHENWMREAASAIDIAEAGLLAAARTLTGDC